jgi:ATP-dependent Clp protease adaptor protein ClpS
MKTIFNSEELDIEIDIEQEVVTELDTDLDSTKAIVVYNDDINTFDHVIFCLMKYCEHTREKAEQTAWEIHTKGKSNVKEGSFDELRPTRNVLCNNGLSAEIEGA